jgi:hypothetical protein
MVAKRRWRCPQEQVWWPARGRWRGDPGGVPPVPSSPCPRPRPASGVPGPVQASSVHACPSTRPLSSVRCGHLSLQVSGVRVRCPAWASGVRGFRCPLCPTGVRSWRAAVEHAAAWLGWPGRRRRPPCPRPACRLPESESGDRGWRRPAGPAEASAWTWASSWEVIRQWPARLRGRAGLAGCARGSPVGGEPGCAARYDYAPWSSYPTHGVVVCR